MRVALVTEPVRYYSEASVSICTVCCMYVNCIEYISCAGCGVEPWLFHTPERAACFLLCATLVAHIYPSILSVACMFQSIFLS